MKFIVLTTVLAALGAGTLVFSATSASAYTVCNRAGECWHTDSRYRYREPGIVVHPDSWYRKRDWDHDKHYHWRAEEHRERGYYRNGVWITF
jgi:hypothetical protein